ncbi:cadherin-like domain-containing protein, partial [uncultured Thiodictyon sp.]|uniref:cadherin-like domain-containing protein n=1 Tax=uncultured Thiodictyon sp. TaxID=1846217 RepID=UPI0025F1B46D
MSATHSTRNARQPSRLRMFKLEPRFMFDGAAAVAGAEAVVPDLNHAPDGAAAAAAAPAPAPDAPHAATDGAAPAAAAPLPEAPAPVPQPPVQDVPPPSNTGAHPADAAAPATPAAGSDRTTDAGPPPSAVATPAAPVVSDPAAAAGAAATPATPATPAAVDTHAPAGDHPVLTGLTNSDQPPLPGTDLAAADPRTVTVADGTRLSDLTAVATDTAATSVEPLGGVVRSVPDAHEILFIDSAVVDQQTLIAGTRAGVEIVLLDTQGDPWQQMTDVISRHQNLDAVHLVSHGLDGQIILNGTAYGAGGQDLLAEAGLLTQWQDHLSANADVLLYGCGIGAGTDGSLLINQFARLTQADLAASTDPTGSAAKGGDWVLEVSTGLIDTRLAFADSALAGYDGLLVPLVVTPPTAPLILEDVTSPAFNGWTVGGGGSTLYEAVVTVQTPGSGNLVTSGYTGPAILYQGDLAGIKTFLDQLKFQGAANYNGTVAIDVTINGYNGGYAGSVNETLPTAFTITVTAVNDAPAGANNAVIVAEDGSHTFTAAEFGFSDAIDGNALSGVVITSLPLHGTLTNNGIALSAGDAVSAANIAAGKLVFAPVANANGTGYGNFTFQVQDDGGIANGGINTDPSAKTMTINVTPVNDAPTTVNAAIAVDKNGTQTFSLVSSDVDGGTNNTTDARVNQYQIDTISADGVLKSHSGTLLKAGDFVTVAEATGMTFTPTSNFVGTTAFTFHAIDAAGAPSTPSSTVDITVNSVNMAPVLVVPGAQTVNEDTSLTLSGISFTDADAGAAVVQATLSAAHGNLDFTAITGLTVTAGADNSHSVTVQGTLAAINTALAGSNLTYRPDLNYPNATSAKTDTITVVVDDLGNSGGSAKTDTKTITVTVNPVPDAPVATDATLLAVNEDTLDPAGATIANLMSGHFSDVDGNTLAGIAISLDASSAGQGIWQYSVNQASTWQAVGTVTPGTALLLDSAALLRFVPTANWNGTPGSLTIHAIDNSGVAGDNVSRTYSSGVSRSTTNVASGSTDIAATGVQLGTSITSVADPFVYVNDRYLAVDEGATAVLTNSILKITNVEATAATIVYTITGTSFSNGVMQFDSNHDATFATTVGVGTTFTQDDIDNNRLRYVHNGAEPSGSDQTLSYTVAEGGAAGTSANRSLTIKVSPVNDTPVLYVPGATAPDLSVLSANVQKGSSLTFSTSNIQVSDPDNTAEQLVFRIEGPLPTHGTLTYNGNAVGIGTVFNYAALGGLKYVHNNDAASSDTFSVTLRDGAGGLVNKTTINLTIGIPNTAPIGIGNLSARIYEDPGAANTGTAIRNFSGYSFVDTDPGASVKGIAIVGGNSANAATQGTWQYSTDGTHWAAIGTVDDAGGGLVLSPSALVRFVPVLNYNGNPGALSVRALDNTYLGSVSVSDGSGETRATLGTTDKGGSSAISGNLNTISIDVIAVNDDPVLATPNTLTLGAGVYTASITVSQLSATDVELDTITYRLESRPTYGWLLLNGTPLGTGSIFTQADINSGALTYQNYFNSPPGTDSFVVTVRDGAYNIQLNRPGGVYDAGGAIRPVQVDISLTSNTGAQGGNGNTNTGYGGGTVTVGGDGNPPAAIADVLYTDKNTAVTVYPSLLLSNDSGVGTLSITAVAPIAGTGHGLPTINGDGTITFTPENAFVGDGSFNYTVTDSNGHTATGTVIVHVVGSNNPLGQNLPLVLNEGTAATITNTILQAPAADCRFTLSGTMPSNGTLYKSGVALTLGGTFTQADIDAGRITFTHDGSEHFISGFSFTLTDGSGTVLTKSIFSIDATPVNDTPTASVSAAGTMGLGATYVFNTAGNLAIVLTDVDGTGDKTGALAYQSTSVQLGFHVTALAAYGTLQRFDGTQWVTIDATNMATTLVSQADLAAGNFRYIQNGTNNFHDSFQLTPDDSKGVVIPGQLSVGTPRTVTLNVVPGTLDPVILNNTGLTGAKALYEGDTRIITAADLKGTDPDNTDPQIQFRITTDVQYGQLLLNGAILGVGSAFTQDDLNNNRVSYRHDGLEGTADAFNFTLSDGSGGGEPTGIFNIEIIPVNDPPVITVPGARIAVEEQPLAIGGISIADADSVNRALAVDPNFGPLLVTLTVGHGTVTFGSTTGLTFANGTSNGAATVAVTGNLGALNAALGTLSYQGALNYAGTDTLTVRTDDLGHAGDVNRDGIVTTGTAAAPGADNLFDIKTVTITVQPINDAPVNQVPAAQTVNEDGTLTFGAANTISVNDLIDTSVGGVDYLSTTVSVLHGTLQAVTGGGAAITANNSASVTIAGTAAQVNAALLGLVYSPTVNYNGADTLTLVTNDQGNTGTGGPLTATSTVAITVDAVNDAPVAATSTLTAVNEDAGAANPPNSGGFAAPTGATVGSLFSGTKYSDSADTVSGGSSGAPLAGMAITANAEVGANGHWQYYNGSAWVNIPKTTTDGGVDGGLDDAHALVLAASDLIRFNPNVANYNGTPGSLTVRLSDGTNFTASTSVTNLLPLTGNIGGTGGWSNAVALGTSVTAINDAPSLTIATTAGFAATEGTPIDLSTAGFTLDDIEASRNEGTGAYQGMVQVTLANADGIINVVSSGAASIGGNGSGSVTITGTLTDVRNTLNAVNGVTYTAGNNPLATEVISVVLSDLGNNGTGTTTALTASGSISVAVSRLNDAPTATGSATLAPVNEDAGQAYPIPNALFVNPAPTGDTVAHLFGANFHDVDSQNTNFTMAGVAIVGNAATGTQGHWQYYTGGAWVNIPPTTTNGGLDGGLDDAHALVLTTSDKIRFNPDVANYNGTPGTLVVRLSDGTAFVAGSGKNISAGIGGTGGWTAATVTLSTTVTKVNDAPIISNLNSDSIIFTEAVGVNSAPPALLLDNFADASLADVELVPTPGETSFNGATLTVVDNAGQDANDFFVIQNGVNGIGILGGFHLVSGLKVFDSGASLTYNGTAVATITDNSVGGRLLLTFNTAATGDAVNAILHNLSYSNNKDALTDGSKAIAITFMDGNGAQPNNAQGVGGALSTTAIVNITLKPSNDAPTFSAGATLNGVEDTLNANGSIATTPATPTTLGALLGGSNFTDPDGLSGNMAGVAIGGFDNAGLGDWKVSLYGTTWVKLSDINALVSGGISTAKALVLSSATQIEFVANTNANTSGLGTPPRLVVFAVENAIPSGASSAAAPVVAVTTDLAAPQTYDTTTDTVEARVSAASVNVDVQIDKRNDNPVITGTPASPTISEASGLGTGTATTILINAGTAGATDPDIGTTTGVTNFGGGTITVSLDHYRAGDTLLLSGLPTGVASVSGGIVGPLVINLNASATPGAVLAAILESIQYKSTSDNPTANGSDATRAYSIVLNDGNNNGLAGGGAGLDSNSLSGLITISQLNDAPVVDLNGPGLGSDTAVTWTEGANTAHVAVAIAPSATLSDADNTNLTQMTLVVTGVQDGDNEKINIGGTDFALATDVGSVLVGGSYRVTYVAATGTFTIVPNGVTFAAVSGFQSLLQAATYNNATDNPTNGDRTLTVSVTDAGTDDGVVANGKLTSAVATATVTVVKVNDAPLLAATVASPTVVENVGLGTGVPAVALLSGSAVSDVDFVNASFGGGSITVSLATYRAGDVLDLPTSTGLATNAVRVNGTAVEYSSDGLSWTVIGAVNATNNGVGGKPLVIDLNASASASNLGYVLNALRYSSTSDDPTAVSGTRSYSIKVNDGNNNALAGGPSALDSNTLSGTITITPVNDAPTLTATGANPTFTEAAGLNAQAAAVTVFTGASTGTIESSQTITGLTFTVSGLQDGASESIVVDGKTITLGANSSGTTTTNGMGYTVTLSGGTATVVLTKAGGVAAAAVDTLVNGITYQNTNRDDPTAGGRLFTLTQVTDSGGTSNGGVDTTVLGIASTVDVVKVNDAPTLTATGLNPTFTEGAGVGTQGAAVAVFSSAAAGTIEAGQNITGLTFTVSGLLDGVNESLVVDGTTITLGGNSSGTTTTNTMTYTVTVSGGTATVVLTSAGVAPANVNSLINAITYQNTNVDAPTTGNRVFTLTQIKDSGGVLNSGADTTAVTRISTVGVVKLNDAATLTATITNPTVQENVAPGTGVPAVTLLSGSGVSDVDFVGASFGGGSITLSLAAYTSGDVLDLASGVTPAANAVQLSGSNVQWHNGTSWVTVGTVNATNNGVGSKPLVIDLNASATETNLGDVLSALRYRSTSEDPTALSATRSYSIKVNDGNNNALAGGPTALDSNTLTGIITITPVNDAPTLTATGRNPTFTEAAGVGTQALPVAVFSSAAAGTIESAQSVIALTFTVSGLQDGVNESLVVDGTTITLGGNSTGTTATNGMTYTVSIASGTATVALTKGAGVASANVNSLIDGITYQNTNVDAPSAGNRVFTLTQIQDSGGVLNSGVDTTTVAITSTVGVVNVNDTPTVTLPASIAAIPENTLEFITGISIADPDSGNAAEAATTTLTLSVTSGNLRFFTTSSGTAAVISGNNSASVVVQGKVADINALLALANNFNYTGSSNFSGIETLTATVNDHGNVGTVPVNLTDTKTLQFTVSGVNNPPVLTAPASLTVAEDSTLSTVGAFTITDPDIAGYIMQADVSVTHGTLNFSSVAGLTFVDSTTNGTATVHVQGTRADIDAALDLLKYTPTANYHGNDQLTVTVHDRGNVAPNTAQGLVSGSAVDNTDTRTVAITVTPVNDRPTADNASAIGIAVTEDTTTSGATFIGLLNARYTDSIDNQSAAGGGNTETALTYVAITGNAAVAGQGTWEFSLDGGSSWIPVPTSGLLSDTNAILISANAQLHFVPAANFQGTPGSLTVRVADNSQTLVTSTNAADLKNLGAMPATGSWAQNPLTLTAAVANVNDAPTITVGGAQPLGPVLEDVLTNSGATVNSLFGGRYSDAADNQSAITGGGNAAGAFGGVAIIGNAATAAQGTWDYSTDNGVNWTSIGTGISDLTAVLLPTNAKLRFQPAGNYNGIPGDLTVRFSDTIVTYAASSDLSGLTGGAQHWSADTLGLRTSITAVNDAPTRSDATAASLAAVLEDVSTAAPGATVASLFTAKFVDTADTVTAGTGGSSANALAGVVIVGNSANAGSEGRWQYLAGGTWTDV